jgi:hypothetical protein
MMFLQESSNRTLMRLRRDCKPDTTARTAESLTDQIPYP